jgi:hypothetical protein
MKAFHGTMEAQNPALRCISGNRFDRFDSEHVPSDTATPRD